MSWLFLFIGYSYILTGYTLVKMRFIRRYFLFLMTAVLSLGVCAQEFNYKHYSIEDGLPTNELYHVMQDSKGFIWISTDYGVCRYDGQEFLRYGVDDGLLTNIIFECYEDSKGRIWFRGMTAKGISYYENDTIKQILFPEKMMLSQGKKVLPKMIHAISEYQDSIFFGFNREGVVSFPLMNIPLGNFANKKENKIKKIVEINPNLYDSLSIQIPRGLVKFKKHGLKLQFLISNRYYSYDNVLSCLVIDDSSYITMKNQNINLIRSNKVVKSINIPATLLSMSLSQNGMIYIGTNVGFYKYRASDLSLMHQPLFVGKLISSVFEDNEQGLWVTTLNEGLYYVGNINLISDNKPKDLTETKYVKSFLKRNNDLRNKEELIVGYYEHNIDIFEEDSLIKSIPLYNKKNTVFDLTEHNKNIYIGSSWYENLKFLTQNNTLDKEKISVNKFVCSCLDTLFLGGTIGAYTTNGYDYTYLKDIRFSISNMTCTNAGLFVGGVGKLFLYKNGSVRELLKGQITGEVLDVKQTKKGIIIATKGSGIFYIKPDGKTKHYTEKTGLISNYCSAIEIDSNNRIWIGTNRGVQIFNEISFNNSVTITSQDGLISNNITDLICYNSQIWVGTTNGITRVDYDKVFRKNVPTPLLLKRVYVNETAVNHKSKQLVLSHSQNNLVFYFTGLSYVAKNLDYKYRLVGLDSTWVSTNAGTVRFTQLNPGTYNFELKAKNSAEVWSVVPLTYEVIIKPAFWQTKWFLLSILLVITGFIWSLFKLRINIVNKQNKLNEELLIARQQALNAQMNPHFVFNVLNSINSYVLENRALEASKYLAKFASLIRKTLENSFKETIPLSDELELLEKYIVLEKIRFNGEFEYSVDLFPNVKPAEIMIPPLLLQPFLENSIWHGLSNKQEKGKINIRITQTEKQILISIVDNGIGRIASSQQSSKQVYASKGMMITNRRLELAKKRFKDDFILKTYDLYHNDKSSAGTKVNLWLSLKR